MFKNRNGEKKKDVLPSCSLLCHLVSGPYFVSQPFLALFVSPVLPRSCNRLFSPSLSSLPPRAFCYTGVVLLLRVLVFELSPFPSRSKVPSPRSLSMVAEEPADSGGCWGPEEDEVLRVALADAARFDLEREGSVPVMSAPPSPSFVGK